MEAIFFEVVSLVGYASSQREKVSLTVRMWVFPLEDGWSGPTKSTEIFWKG